MGANESALGLSVNFTPQEIQRLSMRFQKLDKDRSGGISVEELRQLPDVADNPVLDRVVSIFDTDRNGEIDFKEFIQGVSIFSVKGNNMRKLHFAFRIYDMDEDGFISNGELFTLLKALVGDNLPDDQLQQVVDKTILIGDKDQDGKISFEEFTNMIIGVELPQDMSIVV
jgi:serine/threonine-protein phosphatase 2B regulatory subunit